MTSREMKRLLDKLGATYQATKGGHIKVTLNGKRSILPMHSKDLGPLAHAIRKQLDIQ